MGPGMYSLPTPRPEARPDLEDLRFTAYFERTVLSRRPYVTKDLCRRAVREAMAIAVQPDGRIRVWAILPELGGRALRVVILADGRTVHNAFLDRRFKP